MATICKKNSHFLPFFSQKTVFAQKFMIILFLDIKGSNFCEVFYTDVSLQEQKKSVKRLLKKVY